MKPEPFGGQVDLELPSIQKYLPPGADQDAVNSLVSVYRGHCLLAIDNFRFCKTDRFCESYKSLVGLLTLPGQRLLAHRPISDWIRECDWLKYRKMLPILDQCLDSQMPDAAMEHLNAVAQNLCSWIAQFFQSTPGWTMNAMLGPASIFVSLIDRFLRVNHAANDLVSIVDDLGCREQLWNDWTKNVNPFKVVANSLTGTGHARLISILTDEARFLLGPLSDGAPGVEQHTIASRPFDPSIYEMASNNMVSRLIVFVNSLPTRFPRVDARTLLNMIDVIGSNISRNVSINGSHALPTWWRIKMFIDELSYWLAERGGFVENGPMSMYPVPPSQSRPDHFSENRTSQHRERHQSAPQANLDAGEFPSRQQQPGAGTDVKPNSNDDTSRHHTDQASNHAHSQHIYPDHGIFHQGSDPPASHHEIPEALKEGKGRQMREGTSDTEEDDGLRQFPDDSGIGMGADDEFGINAKYNSFVEGVHGSDPADVVVC
jgi:regulatory factor X